MESGQVCVAVGATGGDAGCGVSAQLLQAGALVVAVSRSADKLRGFGQREQPTGAAPHLVAQRFCEVYRANVLAHLAALQARAEKALR